MRIERNERLNPTKSLPNLERMSYSAMLEVQLAQRELLVQEASTSVAEYESNDASVQGMNPPISLPIKKDYSDLIVCITVSYLR